VPTVLILVDNSSSMFEPREELWDVLYNTLMDPANGIVSQLQSEIRFGFASFKGAQASLEETDPACAEIASVDYALDNYAAINTVYTELGTQWTPQAKWETPTGHAINRVAAELNAFTADPPGPKYIVLVTDGNPNTCKVNDPQCGQDLSIKAVQDAFGLGIRTLAIGFGSIITDNAGCEPVRYRCGPEHLQDLANAGAGLPVHEQPPDFFYEPCSAGMPLVATYSATPGAAPFFTAVDAPELRVALEQALVSVVSCTFDMDATVTGDPTLGQVSVAGQPLAIADPNGWTLEDNAYQVTLNGAACEQFRQGDVDVHIAFPCDPETGEPTAVPRIR
jgi:hypothetical protein